MKVAYWPGCVSRGFTPELHGSMAAVAPKLDIELVELDRANCCGAGVIAEHNQELGATLNPPTFRGGPGLTRDTTRSSWTRSTPAPSRWRRGSRAPRA